MTNIDCMDVLGYSIKDGIIYDPISRKVIEPLDFRNDIKAQFLFLDKVFRLGYKYIIHCIEVTEKKKLPRAGFSVGIMYRGEPWDIVATNDKNTNSSIELALHEAIKQFMIHYKKVKVE